MAGSREYLYFKVPLNTFTSSNVAHLHQNVSLGSYSSMGYLGTMVEIGIICYVKNYPLTQSIFHARNTELKYTELLHTWGLG